MRLPDLAIRRFQLSSCGAQLVVSVVLCVVDLRLAVLFVETSALWTVPIMTLPERRRPAPSPSVLIRIAFHFIKFG